MSKNRTLKRSIAFLLCLAMFVGVFAFTGTVALATPVRADHLVISGVCGGGGNNGSPIKSDYIELFNPTNSAINLTGLYIGYTSAAGAFPTALGNNMKALSGTVPANKYFLIKASDGAAGQGQTNPVTFDLEFDPTTSLALGAGAGKAAIFTAPDGLAASIIDSIGWGNASGNGVETAPCDGAVFVAWNGAKRINSYIDTDNNSVDFAKIDLSTITPITNVIRNSASPVTDVPPGPPPTIVAPTATPNGGDNALAASFATSVALACVTPGADIYYTTDGTDPSNLGGTEILYTVPIVITGPVEIRAVATIGSDFSDPLVAFYTDVMTPPVATPTGGIDLANAVNTNSVSLSTLTSDATIYYTIDGSTPDEFSTEGNNVAVTSSTPINVKAVAIAEGVSSTVADLGWYYYQLIVAAPTANPTGGLTAGAPVYTNSVALSTTSVGATIYYTTDGSTPDNAKTSGSPVTISGTAAVNVKAVAILSGTSSTVADLGWYSATSNAAITIAAARKAIAGSTVTIEGVYIGSNSTSHFVQDGTGGVCVFGGQMAPPPAAGTAVRITGTTAVFNGLMQIQNSVVTTLTGGVMPDPTPLSVAQVASGRYEGMLISLKGVTLTRLASTSAANHTITQNGVSMIYRAALAASFTDGKHDIIGIAGNYNAVQVLQPNSVTPNIVASTDGTVYGPKIDGTVATWNYAAVATDMAAVPATAGVNMAGAVMSLSNSRSFTGYSSSGLATAAWDTTLGKYFQFAFSTKGAADLTIEFNIRSSGTGPKDFKLIYSIDNGATFKDLIGSSFVVGNAEVITIVKATGMIPADANNKTNVIVRAVTTSLISAGSSNAIGSGGTSTINYVFVNGIERIDENDVAAVKANPDSGAVAVGQLVALSCLTPDTTIYYTTDGSTPDDQSEEYITAIELDTLPATIKAIAYKGENTSVVKTFTYTQVQAETANSSKLSGSKVYSFDEVDLSTTDSSDIYYTVKLGEKAPSEELLYSAPFKFDTYTSDDFPVTITAISKQPGFLDSDPVAFTYYQAVEGGEKLYRGQLHSHTTNSDGIGTPDSAFAHAKNISGVDYLAITDHSNSYDTTNEATWHKNTKWTDAVASAAAVTDTKFVGMYGFEMTWSGGPGHINTFGTEDIGIVSRNNATLNNKTNDAGMRAYYSLLKETPQSISQFNHPGTTFGNFSNFAYFDPIIDQRITLLEVGNGEGAIRSGGHFPSYEQYDMALDKGWHLAPTNNQDNHQGKWGNSNNARNVIWTNDFTLSGVYDAMRDMRMYASENKDLDIYYKLNGYPLGSTINEVPAAANFNVGLKSNDGIEIKTFQIITNGGRVAFSSNVNATEATLTPTIAGSALTEGFYYIKVIMANADIAVTAPIWLGKAESLGITEVTSSATTPVTTEELTLTTTVFNNEKTSATLKSVKYEIEGGAVIGEKTLNVTLGALSEYKDEIKYTPVAEGVIKVLVTAVIAFKGEDHEYKYELALNVKDINKLLFIGIDGSHANEYVTGNYVDAMGNFAKLAINYGFRVVILNTEASLAAAFTNPKYKMMVFTAPSRRDGTTGRIPYKNYSQTELDAIQAFAEGGGTIVTTGWGDYYESYANLRALPDWRFDQGRSSGPDHMATQQNNILKAVGSTLRLADDEAKDLVNKSADSMRLYLDDYNGLKSEFLDGMLTGQMWSHYGGSTVFAVETPDSIIPATTLPGTVTPVVSGYGRYNSDGSGVDLKNIDSADDDDDGYGLENGSNKPPKYDSDKKSAIGDGKTALLTATEYVTHANGTKSLVVASGGAFMSNFEIQATGLDNPANAYSNLTFLSNLIDYHNVVEITSIADAKELAPGTEVTVLGTVTSAVYSGGYDNKGFFDCIYIEDDTAGINIFPVSSRTIEVGQKVRFTGVVSAYQDEIQLNVAGKNFKITSRVLNPLTPTVFTTKDAMDSANTGTLLTTQGVVKAVYSHLEETTTVIDGFDLDDGSGVAYVHINGYITPTVDLSWLKVGSFVEVTGLGSIGDKAASSEFAPRIRVRDRAEIVPVKPEEIIIFHTNDMHGSVAGSLPNAAGSMAKLARLKKDTANSLLVDGGDAIQGNSFATLTKGADVIKLMSMAGYDTMTTGNHEFDYGLERLIELQKTGNFPILSANAVKDGVPVMSDVEYANDTKTNNGSYFIKNIMGVKVGFFGIVTPETATKTNPDGIKGVTFGETVADMVAVSEVQIIALKEQGATVIVGLMHLGIDASSDVTSRKVALGFGTSTNKPDIIVDGHSHSSFSEKINGIFIEQAYSGSNSGGSLFGKIVVSLDEDGKVTDCNGQRLTIASLTAFDAKIHTDAMAILTAQQQLLKPVVGKTLTTLWGGTVNGLAENRFYETNLGSLVADAMLDAAKNAKAVKDNPLYKTYPVVAMQNGGGIRDTIKAGTITKGSVLNVLPFGNTLAYKVVTPKIIFAALENGVFVGTGQNSSTGQLLAPVAPFPQIAGFSFEYNPSSVAGSRVTKVALADGRVLDEADVDTKIILATNDFMIAGGDGYTMFIGLTSVGEGGVLDEVLEAYIKAHSPLNIPNTYGRSKPVGVYEPKDYTAYVTVRKSATEVWAEQEVNFKIDGVTKIATTDATGVLSLILTDGPHILSFNNADDVLANNYSGAGLLKTGAGSLTVTAAPYPIPYVGDLKLVPFTTGVNVSFTAPEGVTKPTYELKLYEGGNLVYQLLKQTKLAYTIGNLKQDTDYVLEVKAIAANGDYSVTTGKFTTTFFATAFTSVSFDGDDTNLINKTINVKMGATVDLGAELSGDFIAPITWKSSKAAFATVETTDTEGTKAKLTAVKAGTTVLTLTATTYTAKGVKKTLTAKVTVKVVTADVPSSFSITYVDSSAEEKPIEVTNTFAWNSGNKLAFYDGMTKLVAGQVKVSTLPSKGVSFGVAAKNFGTITVAQPGHYIVIFEVVGRPDLYKQVAFNFTNPATTAKAAAKPALAVGQTRKVASFVALSNINKKAVFYVDADKPTYKVTDVLGADLDPALFEVTNNNTAVATVKLLTPLAVATKISIKVEGITAPVVVTLPKAALPALPAFKTSYLGDITATLSAKVPAQVADASFQVKLSKLVGKSYVPVSDFTDIVGANIDGTLYFTVDGLTTLTGYKAEFRYTFDGMIYSAAKAVTFKTKTFVVTPGDVKFYKSEKSENGLPTVSLIVGDEIILPVGAVLNVLAGVPQYLMADGKDSLVWAASSTNPIVKVTKTSAVTIVVSKSTLSAFLTHKDARQTTYVYLKSKLTGVIVGVLKING